MARKYNGGIQPNSTASSNGSRRLDDIVSEACYPMRAMSKAQIKAREKKAQKLGYEFKPYNALLDEPEFRHLEYWRKLPKHLIAGKKGACQPDGGIWLLGDRVLLSPEAKTQGRGGNAIERIFDNLGTLRHAFPACTNIVFCSGEGTKDGGPIDGAVARQLTRDNPENFGWNAFHYGSTSFYTVDEHTVTVECIKNIIRPILKSILVTLSNSDVEADCLRLSQIRDEEQAIRARLAREGQSTLKSQLDEQVVRARLAMEGQLILKQAA